MGDNGALPQPPRPAYILHLYDRHGHYNGRVLFTADELCPVCRADLEARDGFAPALPMATEDIPSADPQ